MANFHTEKGLLEEFTIELRDHAYGIKSYTAPVVLTEQTLRAESVVVLLNGVEMVVALDTSGYTVRSSNNSIGTHTGKVFETLSALLLALSPEFNLAMSNLLGSRLLALKGDK
ncbi:hypothetical protein H4R24_003847 [Coemansia sp. RSA 988]|nr:hypothetical protein H4R24_003847 [Coemansia sp. RSA 988]